MSQYGVEWDRVLLTTLGVANQRLYELRLQTAAVRLAVCGCVCVWLCGCVCVCVTVCVMTAW